MEHRTNFVIHQTHLIHSIKLSKVLGLGLLAILGGGETKNQMMQEKIGEQLKIC